MVQFGGDLEDSQHIPITLFHKTFFLTFTALPQFLIKLYIFSLDCKFCEVNYIHLLLLHTTQIFNKVC